MNLSPRTPKIFRPALAIIIALFLFTERMFLISDLRHAFGFNGWTAAILSTLIHLIILLLLISVVDR